MPCIIFTELITTIRVVIARRKVVVEPFLIVGIVTAVPRLIVISAEAENLLGTAKFRDVMLEIAILAGTVLLLGTTVLVLRLKARGRRADHRPILEGLKRLSGRQPPSHLDTDNAVPLSGQPPFATALP